MKVELMNGRVFEPKETTRLRFGAYFGFSDNPTALVRFWVEGEEIFVDHEAFGRVDVDETPALFDAVPGVRQWPIKADWERPEMISYMARQGFNIFVAEKCPWPLGDGSAYLKAFKLIHVHERCRHLREAARCLIYGLR